LKKLRTIAIIPARLESSRLPGKALLDICGLPMIVHVFKRCEFAESLDEVFVATDNDEIRQVVEQYGGKVIMTSSHHENGTERIVEAANNIDADIVVNVQGDEALVNPAHIDAAVNALITDQNVNVAILVNEFSKRNSPSDIKTVLDEENNVMYLSRSDIPSDSRTKNPPMLKAYHILPFRKEFLLEYASWEKGYLEQIEYHEHLRILEKGYKIRAVRVESDAVSVDTENDLDFVRKAMISDPFFKEYSI
jgi:3-deoxy-manno-octulosonate cytidylyltransferase (CMP-KDO synthetase)